MSFATALGISVLRAALVAALAVAAGRLVSDHLLTLRSGWRRAALVGMLVAVLLTPALLTGYAYIHFEWLLISHFWVNELLYIVLLWARWMPLAAAVLYFMPAPPLSRSARHLAGLLPAAGWRLRLWAIWAYGPARNMALAGAVVFLLAFQELEVARFLVRLKWPPWSMWLFDAQMQGFPLHRSLALAGWAVMVELTVLGAAGWLAWRAHRLSSREPVMAPHRVWRGPAAWCLACSAFAAMTMIPLGIICFEAAPVLASGLSVGRESMATAALAGLAACVAMAVARGLVTIPHPAAILAICFAVLGFLGPLVLALLGLAAFQTPPLTALYDTPTPLVLVLIMLLTPIAIALRMALRRASRSTALHLAELLDGGDPGQRRWSERLRWSMRGRMWLAAGGILFIWAYFELVAGDLLRPTGMVTAPVLLYNQMHYGPSSGLSAMVLAAGLAPALVFAAVSVVVRLSYRLERTWGRRSGT